MSGRDLLFLLVGIGYFIGCAVLHHQLPYRFENNVYKSDLGESRYTRVGAALSFFGALMYFALGWAFMMFHSFWTSVLVPVFVAICLLGLAVFMSIKMLRARFVKRFISNWSPAAAEDGTLMKLILHQHNCERLILRTEGYAGFRLGEIPEDGLGKLGNELSMHYPKNMFVVTSGGEAWVRLMKLPLDCKKLLAAVRTIPGFSHLELRFEEEHLYLK